ncbi:MAG: hypothetical protein K6D97_06085, partial [Clostridia bacterium]|nr:hypothetical protein [Clostridia bacterium]
MNKFQELIKQICIEQEIDFKLLSDDYIVQLQKDNIVRYIYGFKFDNNSHGAGLMVDDKYGLYKSLQSFDIPAVEHDIVYDRLHVSKYDNNYQYAKEYFIKHNNHIVFKPNHGSGGNGVYEITDISQIEPTMNVLFEKNQSICVCPYYDAIAEYRVI